VTKQKQRQSLRLSDQAEEEADTKNEWERVVEWVQIEILCKVLSCSNQLINLVCNCFVLGLCDHQ
jgi:hypothetical protein